MNLFVFSLFLVLTKSETHFFIPGNNCGVFKPITFHKTIPENLDDLECAMIHISQTNEKQINDLKRKLYPPIVKSYSDWSSCSETCGTGTRSRTISCTQKDLSLQVGNCGFVNETQIESCTVPCEIHGNWGSFGPWSECSGCFYGTQTRNRSCTNPAPNQWGNPCEGDAQETRNCYKECDELSCGKKNLDFTRLNSPETEVMNIPDFQTCHLRCQNENSCRFSVFVISRNSCWIKTHPQDPADYTINLNVITDFAACGYGCLELGKTYDTTPNIGVIDNVESAEECKSHCVDDNNCKYFVYNTARSSIPVSEQKKCFKLSSNSGESDSSGKIRGPKICPIFDEDYGVDYEASVNIANINEAAGVANFQKCHEKCQHTDTCRYYSYDNVNNRCNLGKGNVGRFVNNNVRSKMIAGYSNIECTQMDEKLDDTESYSRIPDVKTAENCQALCRMDELCRFFVYYTERVGVSSLHRKCHLLDDKYPSTENYAGAIYGPKICPDRCLKKHTNLYTTGDNGFNDPSKNTIKHCIEACEAKPGCLHIVFEHNNQRMCWLKDQTVNSLPPAFGTYSANMDCGCRNMNKAYSTTNNIEIISSVRGSEDCQLLCKMNHQCNYFVYYTPRASIDSNLRKKCYLLESKSGETDQNGVISGSKNCS